jgi:HD-GYP domain-containing protein (c-di-GMP phosphodiesterase class II)
MGGRKRASYSEDVQLDRILKTIVGGVTDYAEFQRYHLNRYAEIGMSLSGESDDDKLLEMIVFEAREITNADAGTLYMVNDEQTHLDFVILQNDSMKTRMGGTSGKPATLPPVPLYTDGGAENHANVSSHVALTGEIVNIPDVYESEEFDFTGPRKYDQATGYRSKSMLVIPMRNHENDIIGVLQLLNALDTDSGQAVEFSDDSVGLIVSLASQAAAALTKTRLIQDLKELFDAFIKSIATAIEEKSKYTGGHIARVAKLTQMIAEEVNSIDYGPFKDVRFDADQMEELRLAAWLHDIGKITTPEFVVDKASKLETIYDRVHLVALRFDYIAKVLEAENLRARLEALAAGDGDRAEALAAGLQDALQTLAEEREFTQGCNAPGEFMSDERIERLRGIAAKTFSDEHGEHPYLTEDEFKNLTIRKGTLTNEERKVIENHATMTHKILSELPFPKKMANVPQYASRHHEKLDGSGYPFGVKGDQLSLQARIMAVADVFEALTAKDRPYKKPMQLSQALKILGFMKKDQHIDPDVHDLFLASGLVKAYAEQELNADQVDMELTGKAPARVLLVHAAGDGSDDLAATLQGWELAVTRTENAVQVGHLAQEAAEKGAPFGAVVVGRRVRGARDGLALARSLRQEPPLAGLPVLFVDDPGGECPEPGEELHACLVRPLDHQELKQAVFSALGREAPEGDLAVDALAGLLEEPHPSGADAEAEAETEGKPRILVVDDSVNTRMLINYYLKHQPLAVDSAENGQEGLERFASGVYDLVLMDLEMPVMDGYAAVRAMRRWERDNRRSPSPILALSSNTFSEDEERRKEAGYSGSLLKPFKKADLIEVIRENL